MTVSASRLAELTSLDYFFDRLRRRMVGLTDAEYFWEPVSPCLNIQPGARGRAPRGDADGAGPVTTIAWRIAHIADGLREERNWRWMGQEPVLRDDDMWQAPTANDAIGYLDEAFAAWKRLVASVPPDDWWLPMGPVAGPYGTSDRVAFVVHVMDELIHHGAEVALLRDLYRSRNHRVLSGE